MPLIPTKNPVSLAAYYLGIASFIPFLGFVTALPAIICGIIGIIKAQSGAGGIGHSIAGIICGLIGPPVGIGIVFASIALFLPKQ